MWFDPQRSQGIENDGDVYGLLQQRPLDWRQVAKRRSDHACDRQADADSNALQRNPPRALRYFDPGQQAIEMIDQQDDIGCLCRGGSATRAHRHPDIRRG